MEDLLSPRYKVIADYPNSPFRIGDILEHIKSEREAYCNCRTGSNHYNIDVPMYKDVFHKMDWWEDRKKEEMPEYVKLRGNVWKHDYKEVDGVMYFNQHVNGYPIGWLKVDNEFNIYLPATLSDLEQITNKK